MAARSPSGDPVLLGTEGQTPDVAAQRGPGLAVIVVGVAFVAASAVFMTYDIQGSLSFALELRAKKLLAMVLVGTGLATAAVLFHTITGNRILTPALIGLDALYILIQSVSVAAFGALTFVSFDERIRFAAAVAIMMVFVLLLSAVFLRRATGDLPLLVLGGIVLGGMFTSLAALVIRLLEPNEFLILEDLLFASFTLVNNELLVISCVAVGSILVVVARLRRTLDVVALGRPAAISLGADYDRISRWMVMLIAVLVAVPTALVGPVTFLGLLASNATYELTRSFRHHVTVPLASLSAATLLIVAQFVLEELFDFATRPTIIVGFVGGIVFIVLVLREVK
ncbi:MAG: iron chelate uptake ABC transporter family permease subunit [Actinomycetota bacterium]